MAAQFKQLEIPDVLLIEPKRFEDDRGFMMEAWQSSEYAAYGVTEEFVQDNVSVSRRAVLRGLHYQVRRAQGKLVRVSHGSVFDVAVDLRRNSPTFGRYVGILLSADNRLQLWIPAGFAHGFYVVSDRAEFTYKCSDYYIPEYERTILWNDPDLNIAWPMRENEHPIVSARDANGACFADAEVYM